MIRLHLLGPLELGASDGRDVRPLIAQPKRLAVLAYLAARPHGEVVRRDTLLGVFWPELDQTAGRGSLRQALHVLRTHLGTDAIATRGDEEVGVDHAGLACDVPEFLAAVTEGRLQQAVDLYRGDLLAGFFLTGGPSGFEHWLDGERDRLRTLAARGAWSLAEAAERAGDTAGAVAAARRAAALTPDDEVSLRRLLTFLLRLGDRAGALHAYDTFARRLAREFGEQPAKETRALVANLGGIPASRQTPVSLPGPVAAPRRRRWIVPAVVTASVLVLAVAARTVLGRRAEPPVLAVGDVQSGDSTVPALAVRTLPELLATDLARVGGLRVISHPRLEEVAAQLAPGGRSAITIARSAGADVLLEGELYRRRGDSLRLDLRQVDARSGVVRDAFTLTGRDVFALADSATQWFAGRYSLVPPSVTLAAATSASLVAHGLYDEGLRVYYHDADPRGAQRLFQAALDQDSTFAMAAYYLGRTLEAQDLPSGDAYARAARLAAHAPPHEALFVRVWWPAAQNDPAWAVLAESLAARYPDEPEAQFAVGRARGMTADYLGAVDPLRAAVRMDSLSLATPTIARCVACDAYKDLVQTYLDLDSLDAAESVAREWLRRQPHSPVAWDTWSGVLMHRERPAEALRAADSAARLTGADQPSYLARVLMAVREGQWTEAERLVSESGGDATPRERRWWRMITLRYEGRPRAAAAVARSLIAAEPDSTERAGLFLPLGAALFEAGDFGRAALAFDSAAWTSAATRRDHPSVAARHIAWTCTLRAAAAAAQGDTAALRALADSVAVYGPRSALGRDRLLPSYIHALLLEVDGQLPAALDSLRRAAYSPTEGFTRVNLELARGYLRLGRPRDAIAWLQAGLRGGIEGSNFFVTRTFLRELLARAFAAAGEVDSARAEYALVAQAWAGAEPEYRARRDSAVAYLARTGRPAAHPAEGGP